MLTRKECIQEVSSFLSKKFAGVVSSVEICTKEDLDLVIKSVSVQLTIFINLGLINCLIGESPSGPKAAVSQTLFSDSH